MNYLKETNSKKEMIYLGADHAGFTLKEKVKKELQKKYEVKDFGAYTLQKDDDYPDYAFPVAKAVASSKGKAKGILFCGSAEGICIAANKIKGIKAVPVWNKEIAKRSREHNDANVLCLAGGKTKSPMKGISFAQAKKIIDIWLKTPFSGEERHIRRLRKIERKEKEH